MLEKSLIDNRKRSLIAKICVGVVEQYQQLVAQDGTLAHMLVAQTVHVRAATVTLP